MIKTLAFTIGTIEHQTEKAIKLSGRWFPKSAIDAMHTTANGYTVITHKAWFVRKNRHLAYDELGEKITKSIELADGQTLYQGNPAHVKADSEGSALSDKELDAIYDRLMSEGMSETDAAKETRKIAKGRV